MLTIVNVVFLLLLFYLAAGTLVSQSEFEAEAPLTIELPLERLPRPLLLVTQDSVFLDGRRLDAQDLVDEAKEATKRSGSFLNVLADRKMPARLFLETVAAVAHAGVPLRIVTVRQAQDALGSP